MKCNTHGKFLGYYFGIGAFLSRHPNGIPGSCFVNGETLSLWVWDEVGRQWVDSNRADNWLSGMVDNAETFVPEIKTGVKTAYLYMAKEAGTVTFTHFLNSGKPLSITVDGISVVMLFWNGNYWEHETALLSAVDMDKYFRTEVDSEEKLTKAGDARDASWLETRWDETTFDGKKEAVSRRQMKLGKSAIGVTTDGRAYVEKEGNCKILLTVENLADYAKKDLSNISDTALRDKIHAQEDWVVEYKIDDDHSVSFDADQDAGQMVGTTAEDVDKALYFSTTSPSFGSAISPVSARIIYGRESLSYVAMFVGSDDYVHKIVWDEAGNLTKQYAYSLDDFATKEEVESIDFAGYLTSQGYKPTHVIDLGRYENGAFGIDDAWYWGDVQGAIYNYLDGKCNLLLKGASNYNEPRMYTIEGVERNGDTRFTIRLKTSATRVHVISIDEDAYTDEGERVVTQSYIDLGNSGSGTITSSKFSDTEYTEITNNH